MGVYSAEYGICTIRLTIAKKVFGEERKRAKRQAVASLGRRRHEDMHRRGRTANSFARRNHIGWRMHRFGNSESTPNYSLAYSLTISSVQVREQTEEIAQGMCRLIRTPASHALVFMISPEERVRKPYAFPVQLVPCRSLTDEKLRELVQKVVVKMEEMGMNACGIRRLFCQWTSCFTM